ncbi:MAG: hypothetical protein ABSG36_02305 [Acidimicrobiales bacterium]|jgi:hypothetical protein
MTSAIEHMQAALALLVRQRTDLDRQIKVIERSIYELEQVSDSTPSPPERGKRTVAEVVGALAREQEIVTQAQIMQTLRQEGNTAQATSVSSILSRMVSQGLLRKGPDRATYRRATDLSPEDIERAADGLVASTRQTIDGGLRGITTG